MIKLASLPAHLPFKHPAALIATWFGVGLVRPAPGTMGSLVALGLGWGILTLGGQALLMIDIIIILIIGVWAAEIYGKADNAPDSSSIVVDEVVGQWIALMTAPSSIQAYIVAFAAFRFYDVIKPWPADYFDKRVKGGWGVMLDDVFAGLYALIIVFLVEYWGVVK